MEIGFGDFHLSGLIKLRPDQEYIGYDVVNSLKIPDDKNHKFYIMKDMFDFKDSGDLLITKDVLAHSPNADI